MAPSDKLSDGADAKDPAGRSVPHPRGLLIPALGWLLPRLEFVSPLQLLKKGVARLRNEEADPARSGFVVTEIYVLAVAAGAATWLSLVGGGPPWLQGKVATGTALFLIMVRVFELVVFVAKWLFVDDDLPHPPRAILLFSINLLELRFWFCLSAVLTGVVPVSSRWALFLSGPEAPAAVPWLVAPYRVVSWLIIALAVGALAGYLRERVDS